MKNRYEVSSLIGRIDSPNREIATKYAVEIRHGVGRHPIENAQIPERIGEFSPGARLSSRRHVKGSLRNARFPNRAGFASGNGPTVDPGAASTSLPRSNENVSAAPTLNIGQAALEAIERSAEEHEVGRWDLFRARCLRIRRGGTIWPLLACLTLAGVFYVLYNGVAPTCKVVQVNSDPPRWALVPRQSNASEQSGSADSTPKATSVAAAAAPSPQPDPLAAAKSKLGAGEMLLAQGQLDSALAAYRDGLRALPSSIDTAALRIAVYNRMGLSLSSVKRFPEAIATFRTAVRLFPGDSNLQNNLGVTLESAGGAANASAALAAFQAALRLDPNSPDARDNVAAALRRAGRTAEADRVQSGASAAAQPPLALPMSAGS